ncbi:putative WRKY transcription factor 2 isoform X2 [Bidens hawaiensis]|uniref:putative WRKY transcription factor 2 isoform X2 n=1 Tax=Bidens hawaiensis TaxID=980011 RepID=UPI00404996FC
MGAFGDHGGIIGDWMPPSPSPSPRSLFTAMLGGETGSRSGLESAENDNSGFTFPGPERGDANQRGQAGPRAGLVERLAARTGHIAPRLNTDIIKPVYGSQNQQTQSPYLTVSPGFSPSAFLESPVFLSNSLVQPSPTTGKFQFALNGNSNDNNLSKDNAFEDSNNMSFAFKPFLDSAPIPSDNVNPPFMSAPSFQTNEALLQPEKQFLPQKIEPDQKYSNFTENKNFPLQMAPFEALNGNSDQTHEEHHDDNDADQKISSGSSDDGYNWRKYGQKQVKGSEYPRSYYKCTHPNCPVKKKVERSFEGHITEIIYKGAHNHVKVVSNRRSGIGSSSVLSDASGNLGQESNLEVTSSAVVVQGQNGKFEAGDAVDGSLTFSNDEEDDRVTHGSVSVGYDGEGNESESKRRKVEAYAADVSGATRAIREPRVVVQTTSDVDILDDGYRWRKYGQKVVKGNPNPSYYKCTSTGCSVRKHVERASHDLRSVITTYEGKHNHDVPTARNSSHNNNNTVQAQVQIPRLTRDQTTMPQFERPPYGYGYPMSQQRPGGLAHMAMTNQGLAQYLNQPRQMNVMMPKGEPKVEPVADPGLNVAGGAGVYHQMMNQLPLGHQI